MSPLAFSFSLIIVHRCDHDCSWTAHQQAEGQLYFSKLSNIETRLGHLRLYTEAHLHEEQVCKEINHLVRLLEERLRSQSGPSLTYTEAVLEIPIKQKRDKLECLYYLVDPSNRTIGWFERFDGAVIGLRIGGIPSTEYLCKPMFPCVLMMPISFRSFL